MWKRIYGAVEKSVKPALFPSKRVNRYDFRQASIRLSQNSSSESKNQAVKWILLTIPVGSFCLGVWQIRRREWKLNLMQSLSERTSAEPVDLPDTMAEIEELEYRPVRVVGHFLHEREQLFGPRGLLEGDDGRPSGGLISDPRKNQGWLVVTPFQLHDRDGVILVNRGWVPKRYKYQNSRPDAQLEGEIELAGVVRLKEERPVFLMKNDPSRNTWGFRDLEQLGRHTGSAPIWIDAKGIANPPPGFPIPNQTRIHLRNEHFSYILTWFGLGIGTSLMWHRLFILKKVLV